MSGAFLTSRKGGFRRKRKWGQKCVSFDVFKIHRGQMIQSNEKDVKKVIHKGLYTELTVNSEAITVNTEAITVCKLWAYKCNVYEQ